MKVVGGIWGGVQGGVSWGPCAFLGQMLPKTRDCGFLRRGHAGASAPRLVHSVPRAAVTTAHGRVASDDKMPALTVPEASSLTWG